VTSTWQRSDVLGLVAVGLAGIVTASPSVAGSVAVVGVLAAAGWQAYLEHETRRRSLISEAAAHRLDELASGAAALSARVEDLSHRIVRVENRTRRPGE